jgi:hypothetical protein
MSRSASVAHADLDVANAPRDVDRDRDLTLAVASQGLAGPEQWRSLRPGDTLASLAAKDGEQL